MSTTIAFRIAKLLEVSLHDVLARRTKQKSSVLLPDSIDSGEDQIRVVATKKSKFKAGDRVWFTYAGTRFKQEGSVEHVRKDGLLIVHFDADPPGTILVVQPYEVDPISTKDAYETREAMKKKSSKLDREIAEVLGRWEEDPFGGYRFITMSEGVRFDTAGVDPTYYRDPKWRQRWEFDLKREIEKLKAGKPTKLYKMSETHYRLPGTV